ncbi:MAG: hypothetical protein K1000chlam3_01321, partial [Chlamydiae bacterium]|nr:hypothetical protein [Chlamydiota bacterium]
VLFTKDPEWIALPSLPGALSYHPVHAGREENKLNEEPITYFGVQATPGRERNWPTKIMEEEKLFPYIASEILRLEKQCTFSDFAVLIKDRFQAQRLQLFFNHYKIPSSIKRTLHLAETRGFVAMEMLLKAIAHPENDSHVRAVLKGPLMEDGENPFYTLRDLFKEKGFAPTFAYFLTHHFHGDTSLFLELSQTAELLMQSYKADLFELLHLLEQCKQMSPEMDARLALRGEEGEDKVAIMTTFASKGLEFEVVFALDMASRHTIEKPDAEKEAEKMRQLYVAFTRAREKLYIPRLFDTSKKLPLSPIEHFFQNIDVPIHWIEEISLQKYQAKQEKIPSKPPEEVKLTFPIEILTSFSSLAKTHTTSFLSEEFQLQDLSQKSMHTLPLGAETGTVIHTIFENHFQDRSIPIEQVVCETLTGTHLEGWEKVIADMANTTLQMPVFDHFSLSELKDDEYFQEMEFLFPQKNQWIKGFVDLVFKKGDIFYILDWKTNWLGPSDAHYTEKKLHQAMQEHDYYLQAKLYNEAVQRYVKRLYINPQFGGSFYIFLRGKKVVHFGNR